MRCALGDACSADSPLPPPWRRSTWTSKPWAVFACARLQGSPIAPQSPELPDARAISPPSPAIHNANAHKLKLSLRSRTINANELDDLHPFRRQGLGGHLYVGSAATAMATTDPRRHMWTCSRQCARAFLKLMCATRTLVEEGRLHHPDMAHENEILRARIDAAMWNHTETPGGQLSRSCRYR